MIISCGIVSPDCGWFWLPHAMWLRPSHIVLQAEGFVGSAFDVAHRCRWHTGRAGFAVAVDLLSSWIRFFCHAAILLRASGDLKSFNKV